MQNACIYFEIIYMRTDFRRQNFFLCNVAKPQAALSNTDLQRFVGSVTVSLTSVFFFFAVSMTIY